MDMMTRVRDWGLTVVAGALFVVAVLVMFLPELRTSPMRHANELLALTLGGFYVWQGYKGGFLRLTFGQLRRAPGKPKVPVLAFAAMTASTIAMMMF